MLNELSYYQHKQIFPLLQLTNTIHKILLNLLQYFMVLTKIPNWGFCLGDVPVDQF